MRVRGASGRRRVLGDRSNAESGDATMPSDAAETKRTFALPDDADRADRFF